MNPQVWDLVFYHPRPDAPYLRVILDHMLEFGFKIKYLSLKELDFLYHQVPIEDHLVHMGLLEIGAKNLFVLKPEYKSRMVMNLSRSIN